MTFSQARAISRFSNLHVRRQAWPTNKWMFWKGGLTFIFPSDGKQAVRATDYVSADLLATDWTTVPAPLASCPVTPTEPIGGTPPTPGSPGFPDIPDFPPGYPSSPGGGGPPSITLPTPKPGTAITAVFAGVTHGDLTNCYEIDTGIVTSHELAPIGGGVWQKKFVQGFYSTDGGITPDHYFRWTVKATRHPVIPATWSLQLYAEGIPTGVAPTGGFSEVLPAEIDVAMESQYTDPLSWQFHDGFGTVKSGA